MTGTLLTTVEVAERLGVSSAAVAQAVRTGALEPAARTNDDFLFTERTIAAYAERRALAAASPLPAPTAGGRGEWSGDVGRLNSWLKELTEALPRAPAEPAPEPPPAPAPTPSLEAADPPPAEPAPGPPPAPAPAPSHEAVEPPPAPAPAPAPAPSPVAPRSILERIAAAELGVSSPATTAPQPEPVTPAPVAAPGPDLSRQALLVVQPVVRFRILRDVADRLAGVAGVSDVRLERLEGGVASYRVSFPGERPNPEAIGGPLADLNLEVLLVEPSQ